MPTTSARRAASRVPMLSPHTQRHLAHELTAAGPVTRGGEPAQRRSGARRGFPLAAERIGLIITAAVLATAAAVVALTSGSGWALVVAIAVAATGLVAVLAGVARLTRQAEHVSPQLAAELEEDGIADPDELFNELLERDPAAR